MKLYEHESSKAATKALLEFGKKVLKVDSKAMVYISGRKGNSCLTLQGEKKIAYVPCRLSNHFVCEVFQTRK